MLLPPACLDTARGRGETNEDRFPCFRSLFRPFLHFLPYLEAILGCSVCLWVWLWVDGSKEIAMRKSIRIILFLCRHAMSGLVSCTSSSSSSICIPYPGNVLLPGQQYYGREDLFLSIPPTPKATLARSYSPLFSPNSND